MMEIHMSRAARTDRTGARPGVLTRSDGGPRAEAAADELARMIAARTPGERLGTKDEVRSLVGVSIGTFNETMRLLQARGLVTVRPGPGGGLFVAEPSPMHRLGHAVLSLDTDQSSIAEALRIRNSLEWLIVEDAIAHAAADDVAAMRESLGKMATAVSESDDIGFLRANWQLHTRIAATTPSPVLHSLYLTLLDLVESHTIDIATDGEVPLRDFHVQRHLVHAALVEAIADRDVERARELVEQHNAGLSDVPGRGRP
jgi:DNA-binding FadR family transcriptional regulator